MFNKSLRIFAIVLATALVIALCYSYRYLQVANGYVAKIVCSAVFVSERPLTAVRRDLEKLDPLIAHMTIRVDTQAGRTTVSVHGLAERRAIYRAGLGATLLSGCREQDLRRQIASVQLPEPPDLSTVFWPTGDRMPPHDKASASDSLRLANVVADWFREPDSLSCWRGTHAILIVHRGRIVAERYAAGIHATTPLLGWSMTKTAMNALIGVLVQQGRMSIDAPIDLPAWQKPDDPRRRITLNHLLHMSSGLHWQENYSRLLSDVPMMLFYHRDAAAYAAAKPAALPPDSVWYYSSGTSNIIAAVIRRTLGGGLQEQLVFPYQSLFFRIGMTHTVLEPNASGTFVGSSYMYASARDWARLGLLYLNDGVWEGERILPEGWTAYSTTPAAASKGRYGAHIWLNRGAGEKRWLPGLPEDLYSMRGHDGQFVTIIPCRELVVVRLGFTPDSHGWSQRRFLEQVLAALGSESE